MGNAYTDEQNRGTESERVNIGILVTQIHRQTVRECPVQIENN